jgi:23S rRNA pseudouridine2457 synthase
MPNFLTPCAGVDTPFAMPTLLFNKPFGTVCQFSEAAGRPTLKDFIPLPGVYPAGRLDTDSEGLLILTDEGRLQHRIAHPSQKWPKVYQVQVEGVPAPDTLRLLEAGGLDLGDFVTQPCKAASCAPPLWLWAREPPIRVRKQIPDSWLEITLYEGKNRQVRRMTAKVGHPTLRLIRTAIGPWALDGLLPGEYRVLSPKDMTLSGPFLPLHQDHAPRPTFPRIPPPRRKA